MTTTLSRPAPRAGILDIEAYVPGKSPAKGSGKTFKLSSNETPFGPSKVALHAYETAAKTLDLYPDGSSRVLREAIAARFGLDANRIVCGCGSDDLLHLIATAYIGPGDEAIMTKHGFQIYYIAIQTSGGTPVISEEKNYTADVDDILSRVTARTKVVFLANPNNPTGTYLPFDEVKRLHAGLPPHVLLVLDAAYAEYVRKNDYASGLEMVSEFENVVMTRTFSKIHGLASLRIGWMYAPEAICDIVNRIRGPFNLSGPALAAGAAAINDNAHVEMSAIHNEKWLDWLTQEVRAAGFEVTPSAGNFILVHFSKKPGFTAKEAETFLGERGLIVRGVGSYHLPDAVRITIGTEEACRLVAQAFKDFAKHGAKGG